MSDDTKRAPGTSIDPVWVAIDGVRLAHRCLVDTRKTLSRASSDYLERRDRLRRIESDLVAQLILLEQQRKRSNQSDETREDDDGPREPLRQFDGPTGFEPAKGKGDD